MDSQNIKLRYQFEHMLFPDLFYRAPSTVMEDLEAGGGDYLAFLWEKALELQDIPDDLQEQLTIFTEEDFGVHIGKENDCVYGIIKMPKAAAAYQCSHIGLVLSNDGEYKNYYTMERMAAGGYVLCSWTVEDNAISHHNYMKFAKNEKMASKTIHKMVSS